MPMPTAMPQNWPMAVAQAAPATPMAGRPSQPKIKTGSRMMFTTAPVIWLIIWYTVLPVTCSTRSMVTDMNSPRENTVTIHM